MAKIAKLDIKDTYLLQTAFHAIVLLSFTTLRAFPSSLTQIQSATLVIVIVPLQLIIVL
jgi:hypothetical protein